MNKNLSSPISKWTLTGVAAFAFGLMASLATACEHPDADTTVRIHEVDSSQR